MVSEVYGQLGIGFNFYSLRITAFNCESINGLIHGESQSTYVLVTSQKLKPLAGDEALNTEAFGGHFHKSIMTLELDKDMVFRWHS